MHKYSIDNDIEIEAYSFEDAFKKIYGDLSHREVSRYDFYDITITCNGVTKYFWIRSG